MGDDAAAKKDSPFTLALIAGGIAGTSVDVSLHPLDTLRTRLQSTQGFWGAGGFRGMYKGILSAALGSAPGAAAFFSTYETTKQVMKGLNKGKEEHWTQHAFASSCGEVAACLVRVPTNVCTQRLQVGQYATLSEVVSDTLKTKGIRGFYVGYGTTVAREIPFSFIQFPIYERMKATWADWQGRPTNPIQGAMCGSAAGAIAGGLTTPLDVAKTRIMLDKPAEGAEPKYKGTVSTLRLIAAEEGPLALYKGVVPRVTWITIGGFIFFGAYETATSVLWKTGVW
mmetsp:Transcript_70260/g.183181  ORF Transcript_70260/g.183181 Transcript_70260/m.183181 type:complete len:283 (-) Transcript_70260:407-1255(-)